VLAPFIDGFAPSDCEAFRGRSARATRRFYGFIDAIGRLLHVEVDGLERLPSTRAMIVANHAFGFDVVHAMAEVFRTTGRPVWALGEHAWWRFPFLRRVAASLGTVDGTQENADRLLGADQLVLVLPGGLRESMKPRELRYRLLWGKRYGFVRAAIRNQAPIVPLASIGFDEVFDLHGNPFARGMRWFGRSFPIPRVRILPHRVKLRFVFGEPIHLAARPDQADDPEVLRHARREVEGALQELIDVELARRAGFELDPRASPGRV
jgi:1-acyl-sn-glycerol-3-phosphate acyltransferase